MAHAVTTFLMFEGSAEEAVNFYASVFKGSTIKAVERYQAGEARAEGSFKKAVFSLLGRDFVFFDSPVKHGFTFTPSMSLFVECDSEQELETVFKQLSDSGQVLMPLDDYGFSKRFGWLNDRFGVSWQLNLAA